jgi:hypothetical protein
MDKKHYNPTIVIVGETIEVDINEELRNVDEIPNRIGYWGSILSLAIAEKMKADVYYRQWRAISVNGILNGQPKLAEWKVKAIIESSTDFVEYKDRISSATYNVTFVKSMLEALVEKLHLTQSEKKNEKKIDLDGSPMSQKRIQHMKDLFSNKKEKGVDDD